MLLSQDAHMELLHETAEHDGNSFQINILDSDDDDEFWSFNNYSHSGYHVVNQRTLELNRQLRDACRYGNREAVEWLITEGAFDWDLGLEGACQGGQYEFVRLMINRGANNWQSIIRYLDPYGVESLLRSLKDKSTLNEFMTVIKFRASQVMVNYLINRHCVHKNNSMLSARLWYDARARRHNVIHNIIQQFTCNDVSKWAINFCAI